MAFTLAADSWPSVAAPARAWLAQVQAEGSLDTHLPQASVEAFISRLLRQLLPAVRALDGGGLALANRLAAALQVSWDPICSRSTVSAMLMACTWVSQRRRIV